MANLSGTIIDQANAPLANTTVMLTGTNPPQVTLTNATGVFDFTGLADGFYKLVAARQGAGQPVQQGVRIVEGKDNTGLTLQMDASKPNLVTDDDNKYVPLKYIQYLFLIGVGIFYFHLVGEGITDLTVEKLKDLDSARGVITYFVAVTTIAMAAMLMLAAIMTGGKDLDKRFALGKEILTLLIGVLGTIIGFYYGSANRADSSTTTPNQNSPTVGTIQLSPNPPTVGNALTISTKLTGGTPPYSYSIAMLPTGTAPAVLNGKSSDGQVSSSMPISNTATPGSATLTITGQDKNNTSFSSATVITINK